MITYNMIPSIKIIKDFISKKDNTLFTLFKIGEEYMIQKRSNLHPTRINLILDNKCESTAIADFKIVVAAYEIFYSKIGECRTV